MNVEIVGRRCAVRGRVQGVFYRASTARRAAELGITGMARNFPDGSVEVLAYGNEQAMLQLIEWLRVGPPAAEVSDVSVEALPLPAELPGRFTTA